MDFEKANIFGLGNKNEAYVKWTPSQVVDKGETKKVGVQ